MAGTSFCAGVKGRLLVGQMSRFVRETLHINQANYHGALHMHGLPR